MSMKNEDNYSGLRLTKEDHTVNVFSNPCGLIDPQEPRLQTDLLCLRRSFDQLRIIFMELRMWAVLRAFGFRLAVT